MSLSLLMASHIQLDSVPDSDLNRFKGFEGVSIASNGRYQTLRSREPIEDDELHGFLHVDQDKSFELPPPELYDQLTLGEHDISTGSREITANGGTGHRIGGHVNSNTHVPFEYCETADGGAVSQVTGREGQGVTDTINFEPARSLISCDNVPDIFQRVAKLEMKTTDQHRVLLLTRDLITTMWGKIDEKTRECMNAVEGEKRAKQTIADMEESKATDDQYIASMEQQKFQLQHEISDLLHREKKAQESCVTKEQQIQTLNTRIALLTRRNEELEQGNTNKQKMLHASQRKCIHVESEIRKVRDGERKNREQVAKLHSELERVSEERDSMKQERDSARLQQHMLKSSQEGLFEKQDEIMKSMRNQLLQLKRLREENEFLKNTISLVARDNATAVSEAFNAAQPTAVELECFSCHMTYIPSERNNIDNACCYHPLPAMHFREWSRWPIGKTASLKDNQGKLYWPCCDILSYTRPDGCCHGRHHQSWEVDVVLKQSFSEIRCR